MNRSRLLNAKSSGKARVAVGPATERRRIVRLAALLAVAGAGLIALAVRYWPESHLYRARKALDRHDYAAARLSLDRYLESRPDNAEAHLLLAQLDRRSNNYAEAAKHLDACRRLGGRADAIDLERALALVQSGVYNADLDALCLRHLQQKDADEYVILEALSQCYTKTYRLKEALACLEAMLVLQPDSGYALRRRAWVYTQSDQQDLAEDDYRRAMEIDPQDRVARLGLAQILLDNDKNYTEAAQHFGRVWQVQQDSAVAFGLARSWRLAGRTNEARRLLDEWLASHPGDARALAERGQLAADQQETEQAVSMLERAVAAAPYLFDAQYTLYLCLTRLHRDAEAKECKARIDKTKAESKEAKEEMGRLTRQLQAAGDDPDLRCRIAQIFLRFGEEEGLRWLLLNVEQHPEHRPSHLALADYYDKQGQKELAAEHRRLAETMR
jgi:predicted Zn-dependent protease